jgi:ketosteroid isomerase-like protein
MTTDAETVVRAAYHAAEGDVLDVAGFIDLFAEDGVFNNVVAGETYRGEHLGDLVAFMGNLAPDLHHVYVMGNVVAVELSIQGTAIGPFPTPAGVIQPTGARLDIPTADFWYVENGKIKEFNCYVGVSVMLAQLGVQPDFASAVNAPAAA